MHLENTLTASEYESTKALLALYLDPKPEANPKILSTTFKSVHELIAQEFNALMRRIPNHSVFGKLMQEKKYGSMLRTVANSPKGLEFVTCLLKYKNDIQLDLNERAGTNLMTALHYAAKFPDGEIYKLLCQHGADETIPNAQGQSPIAIFHAIREEEDQKVFLMT